MLKLSMVQDQRHFISVQSFVGIELERFHSQKKLFGRTCQVIGKFENPFVPKVDQVLAQSFTTFTVMING